MDSQALFDWMILDFKYRVWVFTIAQATGYWWLIQEPPLCTAEK